LSDRLVFRLRSHWRNAFAQRRTRRLGAFSGIQRDFRRFDRADPAELLTP